METQPTAQQGTLDWTEVHKRYKATSAPDYPGSNEASSTAIFLNAVAWLTMIGLLLGGAILIIYQDSSYSSYAPFFDRHPYAWLGISSIIVGSIQIIGVIMLTSFVKATVTFQNDVGRFMHAILKAQPTNPPYIHTTSEPNQNTSNAEKTTHTGPPPPPTGNNIFSGVPAENNHAPGWYPDPYKEDQSKWWTGTDWWETGSHRK
jgi:hypothetical protein